MRQAPERRGASLESIITMGIGVLLLAYGLIALLLGGSSFGGEPVDGTVSGERWLGIEGNGWTNILFMAVGVMLVAGSPRRTAAKAMALVGGLILGAASVIAMVDGDDVFGIFAANGGTMAAWGFAALALVAIAIAPRPSREAEDPYLSSGLERPTASRFERAPSDREPAERPRL
jgi:hypothetical protein